MDSVYPAANRDGNNFPRKNAHFSPKHILSSLVEGMLSTPDASVFLTLDMAHWRKVATRPQSIYSIDFHTRGHLLRAAG